ncbi:MAG: Biotin carboxyl carrier protein of acetyl-CoA carboxylase [Gammaproteobacteria bacterium]|jgi:acetyl-CoA carboxylase biotin carboxyl carrier protein|nr:Biotin carboxyl carrier protein of acetyl-CoA carboxylase [Gammaproteobacteria bacterium]
MDVRKIKKLIDLVNETGISELEIKEGEESVRITRNGHVNSAPMHIHTAPVATAAHQLAAAIETIADAPIPEVSGHTVHSPMVGTAYLAPSPQAPAFVKVGDTVQVGDVLCIVEAMKMFNQIEADAAGKIKSILVENGQPVEYGQSLFVIE